MSQMWRLQKNKFFTCFFQLYNLFKKVFQISHSLYPWETAGFFLFLLFCFQMLQKAYESWEDLCRNVFHEQQAFIMTQMKLSYIQFWFLISNCLSHLVLFLIWKQSITHCLLGQCKLLFTKRDTTIWRTGKISFSDLSLKLDLLWMSVHLGNTRQHSLSFTIVRKYPR